MALEPVEELNIGIKDVLDADPRPTFILDLDPDKDSPNNGIRPIFCNAALRTHERLFEGIIGVNSHGLTPDLADYDDFKTWATGVTTHDDSRDVFPQSFLHGHLLWTGSTVHKRWRLISGNHQLRADTSLANLSSGAPPEVAGAAADLSIKHPPDSPKVNGLVQKAASLEAESSSLSLTRKTSLSSDKKPPFSNPRSRHHQSTTETASDDTSTSFVDPNVSLTAGESVVTDWTCPEPKGILSPHIQIARAVDWAATPLGPMTSWSTQFREVANVCMGHPHPCALFWGRDLTTMYNEAYAKEVAGNKHPTLMGTGMAGPWSEIWGYLQPIFTECATTGKSLRFEDDCLGMNRYGILEETYFSWCFTPCYGGTNTLQGFFNTPFETTQKVLSERRWQTTLRIAECTTSVKAIKQFWSLVLEGLRDNPNDVPFALLYSVGESEVDADETSVASGSSISQRTCRLEGSLGVPDGHPAAPAELDLKRSRLGFIPSFREAMRTRRPMHLHVRDGSLPPALLEGIKWRGFGDPCREAVIIPVRPTNAENVLAFLVLGINPRRFYDTQYKAFINLLNSQLSTSSASVLLYEEEMNRSRELAQAALLREAKLSQELQLQANRQRRMTESSHMGMFLISPRGTLLEANHRFFQMTGQPRSSHFLMTWMDSILEDNSKSVMEAAWPTIFQDLQSWSSTLQLKYPRPAGGPKNLEWESIDYWVLFNAHPELAEDGSLQSVMGSITDVSHLKWVEGLQSRQLQEAAKTRRQQNEFMDITSHEMRNPLSAILQSADDITATLTEWKTKGVVKDESGLDSCIESARTITFCVQHQKSIVDDILTISKLDSNLVVLSPMVIQPDIPVKRAVEMVRPELEAKDIELFVVKHPSYEELQVEWVTIDPVRVLQVLLNLLTNAIKFTAPSERRVITVSVGASLTIPNASDIADHFNYVESKPTAITSREGSDWGDGKDIYVFYRVHDTGCGLSPEEKQVLFQRFQQASPRTHAQYGGSGLGLFICKILSDLHGGKIGVASKTGEGSLFGFCIQAKLSSQPCANISAHQVIPIEQHSCDDTKVAPASGHDPNFDPKNIHVLVVEDNIINQTVLVKQLEKAGFPTTSTNDGVEALAYLEETHYRKPDGKGKPLDIVLMDLEMPRMDGLTCIKTIRQMEKDGVLNSHVPVIAVTANVRIEQIEEAIACGMDDVLRKPFRVPELAVKLEGCLIKATRANAERIYEGYRWE